MKSIGILKNVKTIVSAITIFIFFAGCATTGSDSVKNECIQKRRILGKHR